MRSFWDPLVQWATSEHPWVQRVCSEVFRPKPDLTIQYSPSWGSYLVTCVDGELSKDYLVKDRRAPSCQRQVSMDKQMYIVKPCWSGLTKTSLCWKTAALFRRKINFLWRFGGRRADNVQVTIDICRSGLWFGASCKQIDSDRLFAKSIGSGAPVPLEVKRLGFLQEGIAFVDSGGSTSHCASLRVEHFVFNTRSLSWRAVQICASDFICIWFQG